MKTQTVEDRFWKRVDKTGECWEWVPSRWRLDYGLFRVSRERTVRAHRYSWSLANGDIPNGMIVCHHCDNPPCVRPSHLFLGTHQDNASDKQGKGRGRSGYGETQGLHKLTEEQIREIRARYAAGEYQRSLALEYGVHFTNIGYIVRRETWAHVQ